MGKGKIILEITINKKKRKYIIPENFDNIKIEKEDDKIEIDILPIYIKTVEDVYKYTNIKNILLTSKTTGIILLENYKTWFDISRTCTLKDWINFKKQIKDEYIYDKIIIDKIVFKDILNKCTKSFISYIPKENEEIVRLNNNKSKINIYIDIICPPVILNTITKKTRKIKDTDFIRYSLIKCH